MPKQIIKMHSVLKWELKCAKIPCQICCDNTLIYFFYYALRTLPLFYCGLFKKFEKYSCLVQYKTRSFSELYRTHRTLLILFVQTLSCKFQIIFENEYEVLKCFSTRQDVSIYIGERSSTYFDSCKNCTKRSRARMKTRHRAYTVTRINVRGDELSLQRGCIQR